MGQLLRQGGRAVAIYFSDVFLWISLAGIFEILFVLVAGILCILTAGFIFESMKKSPVVLVFGTAVALTGTFLVFREVRGFIWPTPPPANVDVSAPQKPPAPPATTGTPSPSWKPKSAPSSADLESLKCVKRTPKTCLESSACYWSVILERCLPKSGGGLLGEAKPAPPTNFCAVFGKLTCDTQRACYWSTLTDRCETLKVGRGLFSATEPGLLDKCAGRTELMCLTTSGCTWSSGSRRCVAAGQAPPGR